jgi:hypothetical protein
MNNKRKKKKKKEKDTLSDHWGPSLYLLLTGTPALSISDCHTTLQGLGGFPNRSLCLTILKARHPGSRC